jgi:integrase
VPQKLTATFIKSLAPKQNRYLITDSQMPGLAVIVSPNGSKYFYYRYRPSHSGSVVEEPIGNTKNVTLADARKAVQIKAGEVAKGIDLRAERQAHQQEEADTEGDSNLELFNYIDTYYEPYALEHSVTAAEIVKTLKREFVFIQHKPIDQIDSHDIEHWRNLRGNEITFARIKRIYSYLKACINTAVKHYKLINHYELEHYALKRKINEKVNPPKIRYLSRAEEQQLLNALAVRDQELRERRVRYVEWQSQRNHRKRHQEVIAEHEFPDHVTPIVILAYQTGFDIGDIFDLHWEHVDFTNNQIAKVRSKTSHKADNPQPVVVPLSPKVKATLEQWGKQHGMSGRVFKSPRTGGRLDNITKAWKSVTAAAELRDCRFKDLRHTFGSWLAIEGVDILQIRDLMGHTTPRSKEPVIPPSQSSQSKIIAGFRTATDCSVRRLPADLECARNTLESGLRSIIRAATSPPSPVMLTPWSHAGFSLSVRLIDDLALRLRPPVENMANIDLRSRSWRWNGVESIPVRIEEVAGIGTRSWFLPDGHVVSESVGADVAPRCDVNYEISPEPNYVVLVVSVSTILQRKADFPVARKGRQ